MKADRTLQTIKNPLLGVIQISCGRGQKASGLTKYTVTETKQSKSHPQSASKSQSLRFRSGAR